MKNCGKVLVLLGALVLSASAWAGDQAKSATPAKESAPAAVQIPKAEQQRLRDRRKRCAGHQRVARDRSCLGCFR